MQTTTPTNTDNTTIILLLLLIMALLSLGHINPFFHLLNTALAILCSFCLSHMMRGHINSGGSGSTPTAVPNDSRPATCEYCTGPITDYDDECDDEAINRQIVEIRRRIDKKMAALDEEMKQKQRARQRRRDERNVVDEEGPWRGLRTGIAWLFS